MVRIDPFEIHSIIWDAPLPEGGAPIEVSIAEILEVLSCDE